MFYCRKAVQLASSQKILILLALFFQASSVCGQDALLDAGEKAKDSVLSSGTFELTSPSLQSSETGYVTLAWEDFPTAADYCVVQVEDQTPALIEDALYFGKDRQAFISGLPDGEFQFAVLAIDSSGSEIARASAFATVRVKHFSLVTALVLFTLGLSVVGTVLFVILRGSMSASSGRGPASSFSAESTESKGLAS